MKIFNSRHFLRSSFSMVLVSVFALMVGFSANAQILFNDGFDDGINPDNWNTTYGWSAANGDAINDTAGTSSFLISVPSFSQSDYYLETSAGPFKPGYYREYFLLFGLQNESGNAGYGVRIDATFDKIRLVKGTDNIYFPEVLAVVDTDLSETADYNIRVEHTSNGDIGIYLAEVGNAYPDTPIITANDQTYGNLGQIGWLPSSETSAEPFFVDYMQAGGLSNTLLCDDFSATGISSSWINGGGWSIVNNSAYNNSYVQPLISEQAFTATSYIIESTVSNLVTGYYRKYNLFFGLQNNDENFGYTLEIDAYGNENILSLGKSDGNAFYPVTLDTEPYPTDPSRDYSFKVAKYDNGLIQVYLDEGNGYGSEPLLEAIDTTYPTLGQFGWHNYTETAVEPFYVQDICAIVPSAQKTNTEKSLQTGNVLAYYTRGAGEYQLGTMAVGAKHYVDRNYTITSLPAYLDNATFVKTANNDKTLSADATVLYAYFEQPTVVYVAYDPRESVLPEWLDGNGWVKTDDVIGSSDIGTDYFEIYRKNISNAYFYTGHYSVQIGANLAAPAVGANANYFVAFTNAPTTVRYEAESATLSGAGVASNHPGYSAAGFADYVNPNNDYVEWSVNVAAPNNYELQFQYALGNSNARPLQLSIDGAVIETINFTSTSQWSSWSTKQNIRAALSAGQHSIRLTAIGDSGPNIDYLQLSPSSTGPNDF